jgi:hypothetical protein
VVLFAIRKPTSRLAVEKSKHIVNTIVSHVGTIVEGPHFKS